ncbi:TetR/AcrR family transcriptional regulator [Actinomadura sp. WMMB 499]|uniref:TetR/AcrR family transcriptional regulator n=1 Tax=Actinomadura sp. WMMB 499 TaxID=1219491 RepID=UPI00159D26EC|nr:TetR/AcrR family transcriptional regulator [Actinomadura sp. WMMB 499]
MDVSERERLLDTALRLFAELGYDGTSLQLVADATGVGLPTVHELLGDGKPELYRAVMHHALEAERRALEPAGERFGPDLESYLGLVDAYLDFYEHHTDIMALWLHRWMGDAVDVPDLREDFTESMTQSVVLTLRPILPPDVHPDYLIWTIVWCVFGFFSGGMTWTDPETGVQQVRRAGIGPHDPERVEEFRAHLHRLIARMFAPPPA